MFEGYEAKLETEPSWSAAAAALRVSWQAPKTMRS